MAAEYDGYGREELADHIVGSITRRTGRVWDKEAEAQLSVWLLDSANRAMAAEWLGYVGEVEDAQFDPMKEYLLREPMAETLMGSQHNQDAGFVECRRRWWPFRLRPPAAGGVSVWRSGAINRGITISEDGHSPRTIGPSPAGGSQRMSKESKHKENTDDETQ